MRVNKINLIFFLELCDESKSAKYLSDICLEIRLPAEIVSFVWIVAIRWKNAREKQKKNETVCEANRKKNEKREKDII